MAIRQTENENWGDAAADAFFDEEPRVRKDRVKGLTTKQKAARIAATLGVAVAGLTAGVVAAHQGELDLPSLPKYERLDDKKVLKMPSCDYKVEAYDSVEGIYHKLGYKKKGMSLEQFKREVVRRNPDLDKNKDGKVTWVIYANQGLNIPEVVEE